MLNHSWDITPRQAIALQKELAGKVRAVPLSGRVNTIAGADCAFVGKEKIIAVAVLCDARTLEVIAHAEEVRPLTFPYVPGLLSFREAPAVIAAVQKLSREAGRPDLLMIDGHGRAHPRGFGIACHVGLWLDVPTIGVAKSRLCGEHREPKPRRGSRAALRLDGKVIGSFVRTRDGVKGVYVSVGHRITLDAAVRWTIRCATAARLPEPSRQAHQYVTRLKANL
ncbi:MAG: endonuclease V [Phycisphaerae bacterium]